MGPDQKDVLKVKVDRIRRSAEAAGRDPADVKIVLGITCDYADDPAEIVDKYKSLAIHYMQRVGYEDEYPADYRALLDRIRAEVPTIAYPEWGRAQMAPRARRLRQVSAHCGHRSGLHRPNRRAHDARTRRDHVQQWLRPSRPGREVCCPGIQAESLRPSVQRIEPACWPFNPVAFPNRNSIWLGTRVPEFVCYPRHLGIRRIRTRQISAFAGMAGLARATSLARSLFLGGWGTEVQGSLA